MSLSESEKECPLCMETLDWDDLGFFPCSCGYQICRFCWHRLRTDENGLCPACRQAFPDIPVGYNPDISPEELKKQKKRNKERRSKDQVFRPQDLATLRVVQKNLVFVIGLSARLTQEDLKKEFAHFGKIIKFVHNKSTAYITYSKPEEAIRAIRTLNASASHESAVQHLQFQSQLTNGTTPMSATIVAPSNHTTTNNTNGTVINNNGVGSLNLTNSFLNAMSVSVPTNRLKASLGTTKYCNHFLRSQQCPKVGECMYLHEIADAEASFTKEQMQAGKHVEYEKKLMAQYVQQPTPLITTHSRHPTQIQQAPPPPPPPLPSSQQSPQQLLAHQPQQQMVLDSDSDDDGLDFDPISVSTSGLRDLLDEINNSNNIVGLWWNQEFYGQ